MEEKRIRLEKLTQIMTRDFELGLEFAGGPRHTSPHLEAIVLGVSPDTAAHADYRYLKGLALHEVGHRIFDGVEAEAQAWREEETRPGFWELWHALEDARVENRLVRRYPGAAKSLLTVQLIDRSPHRLALRPLHEQLRHGLYLMGRGHPLDWLDPQAHEVLDRVAELVQRGARGRSADDSLHAMRAIYPHLQAFLPEKRAPESDGMAPQIAEDGRPYRKQRTEETPTQDTETVESQRGVPPGGMEVVEETSEETTISLKGEPQEFPEWVQPGTAFWFERGEGQKSIHPSALLTEQETIAIPPPGEPEAYREIVREVRQEINYVFQRLRNTIREREYLRFGGAYRSGKINAAKLWKQRLQNYRLFQRKVQGGKKSVAFTLLVDESGSMNRLDKYLPARKAAIMLGEVLSQLDVPFEIIGYSTAEPEAKMALRLGLSPAFKYRFCRCARLQHFLYKRFDEPYVHVRTRLLHIRPRYNNWDEEHLLFAFRRLRWQPGEEKVIIIISDGQPNGNADFLIETVARLEQQGCRIIGVGIGSDTVSEIYRRHVVMSDLSQLGRELVSILRRELLGHGRSTAEAIPGPSPAEEAVIAETPAPPPEEMSSLGHWTRQPLPLTRTLKDFDHARLPREGIAATMFRLHAPPPIIEPPEVIPGQREFEG